LVLELAVIHQTTDRRFSRGGDLHQVHVSFCGHPQGFLDTDDTKGLVLNACEADFGSHDFTIEPMLALVIARTAVKEISDVESFWPQALDACTG
jgi:hypothetical protein